MASFSTSLPLASPDVIPVNPSKQVRTALKWAEAANAVDLAGMLAVLSDEHFEHHLLPEHSLKATGHPTVRHGKEEFKEGLEKILPLFKTPGATIHEIIESGNKVVVHSKGNGTSKTGHPFMGEWIFIFKFSIDANGEPKIVEMKEFIDSLFFAQFIPAEMERIKNAKAN